MATDVFGSNLAFGGAWKLDGAILTFTVPGLTPGVDKANPTIGTATTTYELIVQGVNFAYKRPVNRLLSLTSSKQYMVSGRGMGQLQMSSIMGAKDGMSAFITLFSDPCKAGTNAISLKPCDNTCSSNPLVAGTTAQSFNLMYVLLDSIAAQVQIGELSYVTETVTGVFGGMELLGAA